MAAIKEGGAKERRPSRYDGLSLSFENEAAIAADKRFLGETQEQGVYRMMYYSHNLHFLAFASCMNGNFAEAKNAAAKLVTNVAPGVKAMPMLEGFLPTPIVVLFAFERWNDILKLPAPDKSLESTSAVWHSLRGIAEKLTAEGAKELLDNFERTLRAAIPHYRERGRSQLVVAFGCTGGRHRSVAMAREMASRLENVDNVDVEFVAREL